MRLGPETIAQIERLVPSSGQSAALDIWKAAGGVSHQTVKGALKSLADRGRIIRIERTVRGARRCFYQRGSS